MSGLARNGIALARLMQLSSQALPIGGFSHSQGLESAIDAGVVKDEATLRRWITDVCEYCMKGFEVPCLLAMSAAWGAGDAARAAELNEDFLATRESAELRAAAVQMGYSLRELLRVLPDVPVQKVHALSAMREPSLPCVWSCAASAWQIEPADAVIGYTWNWAENQVLAAMKAMPLGQSAGQRVLLDLGERIAQLAEALGRAPTAEAADAGSNFAPGLAILSSQHESQYSRLFRS
jgi:urease accessory protein